MFRRSTVIKKIDFGQNLIKDFKPNLFKSLKKLEEIKLRGNNYERGVLNPKFLEWACRFRSNGGRINV
jgi:hypothetical protein